MSETAVVTQLGPSAGADRARVEAMTRATPLFRPEEIPVALDVFDAATGVGRKADPDYETAGAEVDGVLAGWICWGPTPCTQGTFDLYWIVVDPASQGRESAGRWSRRWSGGSPAGPAGGGGNRRAARLRADPGLLRGARLPGGAQDCGLLCRGG